MTRIRHIALRCADTEATKNFYEILGFECIQYSELGEAVVLSDGALNFTLLPHADERPSLDEGEEYIHLGVIVADARDTWERLTAAGARTLRDSVKLRNPVEGGKPPAGSYKAEDPDGNVVDVTDNPDEWPGIG